MPGPFNHAAPNPADKLNWAQTKQVLAGLWPYLRPQKLPLIVITFLILCTTVLQLVGPLLVSSILDNYILAGDFNRLGRILLILVAVYISASCTQWLQSFLLARLVPKVIQAIRSDAYKKLQYLPLSFYDREPFGNIMSRLTNDLSNLDTALSDTTTEIISSVLTVVGALIFMFYQSFWLALATVVTVPLNFFLTAALAKRSGKYFAAQQENLSAINGYAEETLNATILIKAYGTEKQITEKFNHLNEAYYQSNFKANFFGGMMMTSVGLLNNLNIVILGILGGYLVFADLIAVGILASFLQYQRQFTRPLGTLSNQFMTLQLAVISTKRLFELFAHASESEPDSPLASLTLCQTLEVKNLNFAYTAEKATLTDINFCAHAGETLALVGPTGSGKTTLSSLLLRFYDPSSGEITFDGQNLVCATRAQARALIGVVLQDVHLFSGTIADNIRFSRLDASDDEVVAAAKKAHAHDFIEHLEKGYQTEINGNSIVLSQGQKQLLAIARAFLSDPPILILDEATSNVDTLTEASIQAAMQKLLQGRLSLIIAHRLSTVKNAHQILVMRDGKIIERGTHHDLLKQNGFYAQIYHSQDADLLVE